MKTTILNLEERRQSGGEAVDGAAIQRAVRSWLTAQLSGFPEEEPGSAPGKPGGT